MSRKERTPAGKTQDGDPLPQPDVEAVDRGPSGQALTPEELFGHGNFTPQGRPINMRTGPVQPAKKCGWCGEGLKATDSHCPKCVPNAAKPVTMTGVPVWLNGRPLR